MPDGSRGPAVGTNWALTTPHAAATRVGADILAAGGTAVDASIAVAAALAVVYPHMTGIGGDLFALCYDAASGATRVYNGSGAAAALATLEFCAERGYRTIPERGVGSALTVPGAIDGWFALHERFGSIDMARLLAPAIAYARDGVPIARSVARSLVEEQRVLDDDEGGRAAFGSDRRGGDLLVQPKLARTLERTAAEGRSWFYEREGAAAIDAYCARIGNPLRASDLAAHRGEWTEPIGTSFRGFDSLTTPPNTQGLALLIGQSVYEGFIGDMRPDDGSAAFVHAAVEAARIAYADRDRSICDPRYMRTPVDRLLAPEHIARAAAHIDPNRAGAADAGALTDSGSTTYFACVDRAGNAASVIQSIYDHFGSGVVVPELGVVLHNRGRWFTVDEHQPRSLARGRRPFHTLMANMLLRRGAPALVYGSMGGDAQPQFGLAVSIRIAERNLDPQRAIERPRWRRLRANPADAPTLLVEGRFGASCIAGLRARGHDVVVVDDWDEKMGHAGAIAIDRERGLLLAGSDPRSDGLALCG